MNGSNNPHRSVLGNTSPAKLNVISKEWSRDSFKVGKRSLKRSSSLNIRPRNLMAAVNSASGSSSTLLPPPHSSIERPAMPMGAAPPLLRRNSSFFKVDSSLSDSPKKEEQSSLAPAATDRFIPLIHTNSRSRIDNDLLEEELPPANASPATHLQAQTRTVFKRSVAQACGLSVNERILKYLPQPPQAVFKNRTYDLKSRVRYAFGESSGSSSSAVDSSLPLAKLRKINTNPERILDAPGFQDDFYLNLLSWSGRNVLAIALESALYLWNASSGDVSLLVELDDGVTISSVCWSSDDCHISIGRDDGNVEVWDTETQSLVRTMRSGLGVRVASQSWLETLMATGFKSGEIQINDVRIRNHIVSTWDEHEGEVCGLAYKRDGTQLASGGNDNTVKIWDTRTSQAQYTKRNHTAAVKALSWCPYMPNVLASGGGQADQHIHFWNSSTGARLGSINTGSQVSSLHWGQTYDSQAGMNREIVATGGSPGNAISVFNYDTKHKVAEIPNAHESRICTAQLSPDGMTLATVGGDENLKFYRVFEERRKTKRHYKNERLSWDVVRPHGDAERRDDDESHVSRGSEYIIR